ncbi:hypothetical protein TA3x_003545 [Tundrisphaera sp. TA3]|uniref:hypothetical protein n=1 Tax=Tundrisphaera sp. TA3 TaxID=3435775 RepID=UPI003EBD5CA9
MQATPSDTSDRPPGRADQDQRPDLGDRTPGGRIGGLVPPLILLAAMAFSVIASRTRWLFGRPLWLDEFHSLVVAGDPSLAHALSALRRGADFNPPGLFLLLRAYSAATGPLTEASLRAFAFAAAYLGLVGVYALLRASFRPPVALAGALATWAHPLLIHQAFEGRFYAPWFAALAWLAYALNRLEPGRSRPGTIAGIAALSAFICSVHYFGIISLGLLAASYLALTPGWPGRMRQACLGLAAGPMTLAILVPIFYVGQRSAISVPTWITPPDLAQARVFLNGVFPAAPFAVAGAVAATAAMLRRRSPGGARSEIDESSLAPLLGVMGLALMPAAILAISYLLQPSAIDRYAVASVLCVGPVVATLLERSGRGAVVLACVGFLGLATIQVRTEAQGASYADSNDALRAIAAIRADGPGSRPVLTDRRGLAYQFWRHAPEQRGQVRLIDLSGEYQGTEFNFHRLERDVAARLAQLYDVPGVTTLAEGSRAEVLYLLAQRAEADRLAARFPGHRREDLHVGRVVAMKLTALPGAGR